MLKQMIEMARPKVGDNEASDLHTIFAEEEWMIEWNDFDKK